MKILYNNSVLNSFDNILSANMQQQPSPSDLSALEKWPNSIKFKIEFLLFRISNWMYPHRIWVMKNFAIVTIFTFTFFAILFVAFFPHTRYASWHLFNSGTIGDSVGGMTAPFIGILNAILLWWTLKSQNQQIILQNHRTNLQKRLEAIDVAMRNSSLTITVNEGPQLRVNRVRGAEAFFRAKNKLRNSTTVADLNTDPDELELLLKNAIGIYRSALLAVEQNDQILLASQNTPLEMSTEEWVSFYQDLAEQIDDVREYWQAYRHFFDQNRSDQSFASHDHYILFYTMRDKFERMQNIFQGTLGPQEPDANPEPDWK
ncbi:hypothetical protein ACN9ML_18420 [Dyadobacter endophyticus]|uniref:hypothetical protein n=1 Tax=Dyadobacter endophyticus TaxID=1749036 RepID=UPI003CE84F8F